MNYLYGFFKGWCRLLSICKSSECLSTSDHFLHSHRPSLGLIPHQTRSCPFCLGASRPPSNLPWCYSCSHRVSPLGSICVASFLPRTNSKHVCLWSSILGWIVIYSLNRANPFRLGRRSRRFLDGIGCREQEGGEKFLRGKIMCPCECQSADEPACFQLDPDIINND